MKYALLMYADPRHTVEMTQEQFDEVMRKHTALGEELGDALIGGSGLALPEETILVRASGTSTGPLVEAVEQLTAYYEIEATLERAREIAAHIVDHHVTAVEIRRIHDQA
jgi:hypothetical protein